MINGVVAARLRDLAPLATLVILFGVVVLLEPAFLSLDTLRLLGADTATLFIMAAGLTWVVLLGGIDLSVQALASLSSVVVALLLPQIGALAILVAVLAGVASGLASGAVVARLRIPSFIATLAMGGVAAALALVLSGTRSVPLGEQGGAVLRWITSTTLSVPNEVLIATLVLLGCLVLERTTVFGRWITAVGAGEPAAIIAGVPSQLVKVAALALSGGLAAFSGVVLAARLNSGSPTLADQFLLPAVAAVCVGGTALTGGVGGVLRTLIGALIV